MKRKNKNYKNKKDCKMQKSKSYRGKKRGTFQFLDGNPTAVPKRFR